ncbi:MAG: amidohydrolase family protein [Alphaproteobacteria bacterium]|nr:amidohydrolase family protein [Alphaproteobacteria bacterium]
MTAPHAGPVFDAHLHIVDPHFPLVANDGYLPPPFRPDDYRAVSEPLGISGGAIVSGSFQAFDQDYLLAALAALGPTFVGVTQVPASTLDHEILALDKAGVRAVRFNVYRGGSESFAAIGGFARRIHRLCGWHVELYADLARLRPAEIDVLAGLPQLVIDHLGISEGGLARVIDLAAAGAKVKATGFGRVLLDPETAMERIAAANPDALMFGSDLPSTRAPRPFEAADMTLIASVLGPELSRKAFYENAIKLYRPRTLAA